MWHHKPGTLAQQQQWGSSSTTTATTEGTPQKTYNVKKELKLDANARWNEVLRRMKDEVGYEDSLEGRNSARERWARGTLYAHRLAEGVSGGGGSSDSSDSDSEGGEGSREERERWVKHLEELHYLEMIDPKHRYGSNLKYYHQRWLEEDTEDNFFKWLDRGAGLSLSLSSCPRQHLESATIRYLTPEQRWHYLVLIDPSSGRLRWAHSGQWVDTTSGEWEDRGEGRGVERVDSPLRRPPSPSAQEGQEGEDAAFADTLKQRLRRRLRHQPWIYVCSASYSELYVGLKSSGAFQHSSFLGGGAIGSAGTIGVREGRVRRLDPLSGHYRTSVEHFGRFVEEMRGRGMDVRGVCVGRAVATLWGDKALKRGKQYLHNLLGPVRPSSTSSLPTSISMPVPQRSARPLLAMTPLSPSPPSPSSPPPSRTPPSPSSLSSSEDDRRTPPTPTRRSQLLLTPLTPLSPANANGSGSPETEEEREQERERVRERREMLYGRPPSVKAKKSLERVLEVPEPREEVGGRFVH